MAQALQFTADFKLGHYMKVPPRLMFFAQVLAAIIAGTTQLGVQSWMFSNIPDMCSEHQPDGFICPGTEVFGTASIIWGVIGPARQFSKGQIYYGLSFFFLVGFVCPVITWILGRKWPNSWLRYVKFVLSLRRNKSKSNPSSQLPSHFLRDGLHPTSQRSQLRPLGHRGVPLPICHPTKTFLLVDQVQLCTFGGNGLWGGCGGRLDFLLPAVSSEWEYWAKYGG